MKIEESKKKAKPKLTAQRNLDIMRSKLWTIGLLKTTTAKSLYGLKIGFHLKPIRASTSTP